ncbi:hypothetical protein EV401DRAFT_884946 [Pisolithus croceorrhizus]|nr:hypothetical protein EV401DRAFT_884946 [Pisolithus croceorrhizus]
MSLNDEQADILGGPLLQKPQSGFFGMLTQHLVAFKGAAAVFLGLLAWATFVHLREYIRRNRDLNYRKAMRRKHGIPDSDCRPFAVAYAAANRARTEREARERNKLASHVPSASANLHPGGSQHRISPVGAPHGDHQLRRRLPESSDARGPSPFHDFPGIAKRVQVQDLKRPDVDPPNFAERYNPNTRHSRQLLEQARQPLSPTRKPAFRRISRKTLHIDHDVAEASRKRSYAAESDSEPDNNLKKTRIDGEDLIDRDEDADWYAQYVNPRSQPVASSSRVSINGQSIGHEADEPIDEIMEDPDDEVTELSSIPRGKKRDRAEAGSTFGADDDDDAHNEKPIRHRKRRSVSKRKSEAHPRGRKRDREVEFPESEGEGAVSESVKRDSQRTSKKRKEKRASPDEIRLDASAEDARVSKDPLCGGRKIGEEWEVGAIRYKVGDKGERLRLVLVKKARSKYHMPEDSQHPDRAAALEIYVETWMTEEQYKQAEERQDVVSQDGRPLSESASPQPPESPSKKGKDLLWDSVTSSPTSRRPFRQSLTANTTMRINPFQQSPIQSNLSRRIASPSASVSPHLVGVTESPTRSGFRGFSKWEKQDREAEAMAKIRAKMQEQKKGEAMKSSEQPTGAISSESCAQTLTVPAITLTPASPSPVEGKPVTAEAKSPPSFSFGQPSAAKTEVTTPTPNTAAGSGFSVLPSATPASSTATSITPQPSMAAPTTAPPSTPSFSFAPPTQPSSTTAPTATTTPSTSTSVPNFLAKPAAPAAPAATPTPSATSPFSFAAPAQTQPSAGAITLTTEAPKAPAFSFAKPGAPAQATPTPSTSTPATTASAAPLASSNWQTASPAPSTTVPPGLKPSTPVFSFSATPTTTTTSTTASLPPKFSFGQPPVGPAASTATASTAADSKPKFIFGAPSSSSGPPATGETKKESASTSTFSGAAGATTPAFSSSIFGAPSSTSAFGKQTEAGAGVIATNPSGSSDAAPKPVSGTGTGTSTNMFSTKGASSPSTSTATPANSTFSFASTTSPSKGASSFGNTAFGSPSSMPSFAFGKKDDTSTSTAVAGSGTTKFSFTPSNSTLAFGQPNAPSGEGNVASSSSATASKPTFSFTGSSGGTPSIFSQRSSPATKDAPTASNDTSSKPMFSFATNASNTTSASSQPPSSNAASSNAPAKPSFPFGVSASGASSALAPGPSSSSNPAPSTTATEAPKSTFSFASSQGGSTAFGLAPGSDFAPKPTFSFNPPAGTSSSSSGQPSTTTTSQPAFGAPSPLSSSTFGSQPLTPGTPGTGEPTTQPQSVFGKPSGTAPSAFGFSTASGNAAFSFGKPASQNQKQEQ